MCCDQCRLEHHVPQGATTTGSGPFFAMGSTVVRNQCGSILPELMQAAALLPGAPLALWLIDHRFAIVGLSLAVMALACIFLASHGDAPTNPCAACVTFRWHGLAAADHARACTSWAPQKQVVAAGRNGAGLTRQGVGTIDRGEAPKARPSGLGGLCAIVARCQSRVGNGQDCGIACGHRGHGPRPG